VLQRAGLHDTITNATTTANNYLVVMLINMM